MKKTITVGIGEYAICNNAEERLVTHALGSCVAFVIHCPVTHTIAMAHIVLPRKERNYLSERQNCKPGYYADEIVPWLLSRFIGRQGCKKHQLKIFLIGGAESMNNEDIFKVGTKNAAMILKQLRRHGLKPTKMDIGGTVSRTLEVKIDESGLAIRTDKRCYVSRAWSSVCWIS